MKWENGEREHERIVSDRCAEQYTSLRRIEQHLVGLGWDSASVERMIKYISQKEKFSNWRN